MNSQPCPSKDEAKRDACLKACIKLHELGALTEFLLPGQGSRKKVSTTNISESNKDEGMVMVHYSEYNVEILVICLKHFFPCFR